jgi:hypothetical protein
VIENWERTSPLDEYTGDTGEVTIQSSTVQDGSNAAEINAGQYQVFSAEGSGLQNYPSQGDVFAFWHNFPSGARPRFIYGFQDSSNYYYVELDDRNDTLKLVKVDGGSETTLDGASVAFDNNAWVQTKVEWRTNGRQLITHTDSGGSDVASLDATDDTRSGGGVGWGEWSGGIQTIDNFEDNNLDEYTRHIFANEDPFEVTTANVYEGTYSLEATRGDDNSGANILSDSGLDKYPAQGDVFQTRFYHPSSGSDVLRADFFFGVQDETDFGADWYRLYWGPGPDSITFQKRDSNGNVSTIASNSFSNWVRDEWIRAEIDWQTDGTMTGTLYDSNGLSIVSVTGTDTDYASGGIGFGNNTNGTDSMEHYWDIAVIQ